MTDSPTLFSLLADGHWHSGADLADRIGVSRAAISARIKKLSERGLSVYSVVGRGYRLARPGDSLAVGSITDALSRPSQNRIDDVRVFETVDSTSNVLEELDDGATRLVLAEAQTAGRGRTGRHWVSPFGCNLHLSLIHRCRQPQAPMTALSPIIGVALARMLADSGIAEIGLKWPNDLLIDGAKTGGILVDYRGEAAGDARLIVGIGINVSMATDAVDAIDQSWTTLSRHLPESPSRNGLAGRVADAALEAIDRFSTGDTETLADDWRAFDQLADMSVKTYGSNAPATGTARGINVDGSLRIEAGGAVSRVYSGDVTVRDAS